MKQVILDTNGLISFVTNRNVEQQAKIARIFQDASKLKCRILCHHHVLSEFVYVLNRIYHCSSGHIHSMITNFVEMPGVEMVSDVRIEKVLKFWPAFIPDYGDAVIAAMCTDLKSTPIATFDKKFKKALHQLNLPVFEL